MGIVAKVDAWTLAPPKLLLFLRHGAAHNFSTRIRISPGGRPREWADGSRIEFKLEEKRCEDNKCSKIVIFLVFGSWRNRREHVLPILKMVIETFRVVKVLSLWECWRYVCESIGGVQAITYQNLMPHSITNCLNSITSAFHSTV